MPLTSDGVPRYRGFAVLSLDGRRLVFHGLPSWPCSRFVREEIRIGLHMHRIRASQQHPREGNDICFKNTTGGLFLHCHTPLHYYLIT